MQKIETAPYSYVPGACNIGPAEIKKRLATGWTGAFVTALLFSLLVIFHVDHWWRLTVFLPAVLAASGFLQVRYRFCAGYGQLGVFNVADPAGKYQPVQDAEAKKKDKNKARSIGIQAAIIAAATAITAFFLPF